MKFYSTNNKNLKVDLREAVIRGLAPDNGLFMPEQIPMLPANFFLELPQMSFKQIGLEVVKNLLGKDVEESVLEKMIDHTLQFEAPVVKVEDDVFALELFHGPTLAFKDFGARFMSQLLSYFAQQQDQEVVILVATSGDTGSAVANGFLGVKGTKVIVLYPSGKVSEIQEKQFTTLEQNITAVEVKGTFDDCQRLVKQAFLDEELRRKLFLTSANSINIARLIPQSFYYFSAYAQVMELGKPVVFSVPSGNFGNLTGGLLAQRMGLPIEAFIAATNINDVVPQYLHSKIFKARASAQTISNAMDVGDPSNFVRLLDLFGNDFDAISRTLIGYSFNDDQTRAAMRHVKASADYVLDPHGAVGYLGLQRYKDERATDVTGIFLETAHPAKFKEVVEDTLKEVVAIPDTLQKFIQRPKRSVAMKADFKEFKSYLSGSL